MGDRDVTREFVESAARGEAGALDALIARFLPGLAAFVRGRAGGIVGARESSSDLVQSVCREVLEQVADERFEYRGEAEMRKWLYAAALHKIQNRRRFWQAERRDPGREVRAAGADESSGTHDALFQSPLTPSHDAAVREELERVERALAQLPERDREIVRLAQLEGRSHREIAQRLGVTEAYSRVLLSRALARLATLSAGGSDGDD